MVNKTRNYVKFYGKDLAGQPRIFKFRTWNEKTAKACLKRFKVPAGYFETKKNGVVVSNIKIYA